MKFFLHVVLLLIFVVSLSFPTQTQGADQYDHVWTRTLGGTSADYAYDVAVDSNGFVYVFGVFQGTNVDFDATAGTDLGSSAGGNDLYLSKYAADGSYVWTKVTGGSSAEQSYGIAIDSQDNVYIAGSFNSSNVNFNKFGGTDTHSSAGLQDIFLTKYNADGTYGWTKSIGGTGNDIGFAVGVDASDNVFVTGGFSGTNIDFNDSAGNDLHSSAGVYDVFITKHTSDGTYGWTRTFGGSSGQEFTQGIAFDADGNIYVTGDFVSTNADFDGTSGTDTKSANGANDVFITRYNADSSYGWTRTFGGGIGDRGNSIAVDGNAVYTTGYFAGSDIDIDGTAGEDLHSPQGTDMFLTKYMIDGTYGWTRVIGGSSTDQGRAVRVDENGDIVFTGIFQGTDVDFDGTAGEDLHSSLGGYDIFVAQYASDGSYGWAHTIGGASTQYSFGLDIDSSGGLFLAGGFEGTDIDLDFTDGTDTHTSNGSADAYAIKYIALAPTPTPTPTPEPDPDPTPAPTSPPQEPKGGDSDYSVITSIGTKLTVNVTIKTPTLIAQAKRLDKMYKTPVIEVKPGASRKLTTKVPDADRAQSVILRVFGKTYILKPGKDGITYHVTNKMPTKEGVYPYTLTINYGSTTLSEKGEFKVEEGSSSPTNTKTTLPKLNSTFRSVFDRDPTFSEWSYWAGRIIAGDKPTIPELLGAMEWQRLKR